jgi:hypothetical protein
VSCISFSQNCIEKYTGTYAVDIEATMSFFDTTSNTVDGVLEDDFREMIESITLIIYTDSLSLEMLGNKRVLPFSNRISVKENGSCDLLLDMSNMAVSEEENEMFLTVYEKKKKRLQIINSVDSKEMDNYIWLKTP